MAESKVPMTPEVEAMLNQALEDMLKQGKPAQVDSELEAGLIYHPKVHNKKLYPQFQLTAAAVQSYQPHRREALQKKLNWLLSGLTGAEAVHDLKLEKKIRRDLRKEGYFISQHGKGPVNFNDPKWQVKKPLTMADVFKKAQEQASASLGSTSVVDAFKQLTKKGE